jgi:UDP-N-acetyl-D-mannosaminuronate dehydrogenase
MKYYMTVGSSDNCIYGVGTTAAKSREDAGNYLDKNNFNYVYFRPEAIECSERLHNYIKNSKIRAGYIWQIVNEKAELTRHISQDVFKKSKNKKLKMTEKKFKNINNIPDMLPVIFNMLNK